MYRTNCENDASRLSRLFNFFHCAEISIIGIIYQEIVIIVCNNVKFVYEKLIVFYVTYYIEINL